jgi:hypothetical protein
MAVGSTVGSQANISPSFLLPKELLLRKSWRFHKRQYRLKQ